jgi:hypothetical protein
MRVPDEWLGKKVRCPSCQDVFVAPAGQEPGRPAEPARPAYKDLELDLSLDEPGTDNTRPTPATQAGCGFGFVELNQKREGAASGAGPAAPASAEPAASPPLAPRPSRPRPPRLVADDPGDRNDCPACGESLPPRSRHCPHCGKRLRGRARAVAWDDEPPRRDWEPDRGGLVLTLGVLSLVFALSCGLIGLIVGIAAWAMGQGDLARMRARTMGPGGYGLTQAGWVCGLIGTVVSAVWMLFLLFVIVMAVME